MNPAFANRLWLLASRRAARDFQCASLSVVESQSNLLQTYLTRNQKTAYLEDLSLPVTDYSKFPLTSYGDYAPYIERIANGEKYVLTREPVQLFEPSSGSSAASKMIPYTRSLKREFQLALSSWITDLYSHHPDLITGSAYWSISPLAAGPRRTPAGIPVGFEDDSAYLGPFGSLVESSLMAVPGLVKQIPDMASFRYVTLLFLLRCEDLRLISVWNPTFLTLLVAPLPKWWEALQKDIAEGTVTPPAPLPEMRFPTLSPNPSRARALARIRPTDYTAIWKGLTLISCWADGASELYARELQAQFPDVTVQPKGLLATEAFVSFPLCGKKGGVLAVTSHYFEFLAENGDILLAHQLEHGKSYSVIVTTGGGLYRYRLNDIVEVVDFFNQIPCIKFVGRADRVSDYYGEKLNEQFVADTLKKLLEGHALSPVFAMLAPEDTAWFHYTLYLELPDDLVAGFPGSLAQELDSALRANFHYDYCRRLGQLAEAQIKLVRNGNADYIRACQQRQQKLGDIKPSVLQTSTGWEMWFQVVNIDR